MVWVLLLRSKLKRFYNFASRTEARLSRNFKKLQTELSKKKQELTELSKQIRNSEKLSLERLKKLEKLRRRSKRKSGDEQLTAKVQHQQQVANRLADNARLQKKRHQELHLEIHKIEKKLALNRSRKDLISAETWGHIPTLKRHEHMFMIEAGKTALAMSRLEQKVFAHEAAAALGIKPIKPNALSRATDSLERFEGIVNIHEADANVSHNDEPAPRFSAQEQEDFDCIVAKTNQTIDMFANKINRLSIIATADPNLERVYERLVAQVLKAQEFAANSIEEEIALEQLLYEANTSDESSRLSVVLRKHRTRNILNNQRLFEADNFIRRILVVKIILNAFPKALKSQLNIFKSIISNFFENLLNSMQNENKLELPMPETLASNLANLEYRMQALIVTISAPQLKKLNDETSSPAKDAVPKILETIRLEIEDQRDKLDQWTSINSRAILEGTELVKIIASRRTVQCEATMKSFERTHEVLSNYLSDKIV